ncbi:MAG TPA: cell division protein ZapD [Gammaproteobacteria bacterium]
MDKPVIFEHPLNERVRTMLRLEHLFSQARHYMAGNSSWDSRVFITTLMNILDIFARGDLKTEIIKEVERATNNLKRLMEYPSVDHERLKTILRALDHVYNGMHGLNSQLGQTLRDDEFLASIRQRTSIPGGTCDFDLPAYHQWLQRPLEQRAQTQGEWFASLEAARQAVELVLKLIRNSAEPVEQLAEAGAYQQPLDPNLPFQLIRIQLPAGSGCYPEVSGGRHRFTIRFLGAGENSRPSQISTNLPFLVTCCNL